MARNMEYFNKLMRDKLMREQAGLANKPEESAESEVDSSPIARKSF